MTERDWARDSVTLVEEGKTRSPEEVIEEHVRSDLPLDVLPVEYRAFYRVVYGLDVAWEDVQHIAAMTGKPPRVVLDQIRVANRKNTGRRVDVNKLNAKVVSAYSRLTELAKKEKDLEEKLMAQSRAQPQDKKKIEKVAKELHKVRERMDQLRALQQRWREESIKVLRIHSKDVAEIFNSSPNAVDQQVRRLKKKIIRLLDGWRDEDEKSRDPA